MPFEQQQQILRPILHFRVLTEVEEIGLLQTLLADHAPILLLVVGQRHIALLTTRRLFLRPVFEITQGQWQFFFLLSSDEGSVVPFCLRIRPEFYCLWWFWFSEFRWLSFPLIRLYFGLSLQFSRFVGKIGLFYHAVESSLVLGDGKLKKIGVLLVPACLLILMFLSFGLDLEMRSTDDRQYQWDVIRCRTTRFDQGTALPAISLFDPTRRRFYMLFVLILIEYVCHVPLLLVDQLV
jgi:hypothetical protein